MAIVTGLTEFVLGPFSNAHSLSRFAYFWRLQAEGGTPQVRLIEHNIMVRKDDFLKVGFQIPHVRAGRDRCLVEQLNLQGKIAVLNPKMRVQHEYRFNPNQFVRYYRSGHAYLNSAAFDSFPNDLVFLKNPWNNAFQSISAKYNYDVAAFKAGAKAIGLSCSSPSLAERMVFGLNASLYCIGVWHWLCQHGGRVVPEAQFNASRVSTEENSGSLVKP